MTIAEVVSQLWRDVLNIDELEPDQDFFEEGGDSLRAIQLASRISSAIHREVPATLVLESHRLDALILAVLQQPDVHVDSGAPPPGPRPLSSAQQAILLADELADEPGLYNVTLSLAVDGDLVVDAQEMAIASLVDTYEALRYRVVPTGDGPVFECADRVAVPLSYVSVGLGDGMEQAVAIAQARSREPFDLAVGPLLRALLIRRGPRSHLLVLTLHHLISDRRSRDVMARTLVRLYDEAAGAVADRPSRSPEPVSAGGWSDVSPGPASLSQRATSVLNGALRTRLHRFATTCGVTPFTVMLAVFSLLWRGMGDAECQIGVPTTTRREVGDQDAVGCFIGVRALSLPPTTGESFVDVVRQVRDRLHRLPAGPAGPSVEVAVSAVAREPLPPSQHLDWVWLDLPEPGARFGLDVLLLDEGDRIVVRVGYRPSSVAPAVGQTIPGRLAELLDRVLSDPDRDLSRLELCTPDDLSRLASWADGGPAQIEATIPDLIHGWARRQPTNPAIVTDHAIVTYAELEALASAVAGWLVQAGIRAETVVAVWCQPSVDFVVAALGIMKAGAAYLPLDPAAPPEHINAILTHAGASVVVADRQLAALGPLVAEAVLVEELVRTAGPPPSCRLHPRGAAYVVYTSGSTGAPKGVVVEHASLAALVGWMIADSEVRPGDRCSQIAALGFDAAVWEVWGCLGAGATLSFAPMEVRTSPDQLAEWLDRSGITIAFVPTPTLPHLCAVRPAGPPSLRVLHTGGDMLHSARPPSARYRLVNNYGPTEAAVVATSGVVDEVTGVGDDGPAEGAPSIGRPIAGTTVRILDDELRRQPPGWVGELAISGAGLARGYLGDPGQTAERFRPDPFASTPGARMYLTGDRARFRPAGDLDFIGRVDRQVKVSGVRVELVAVEAALLGLPGMLQAAVTARPSPNGDAVLTAHLVTPSSVNGSDVDGSAEAIRRALAVRVPRVMVPATIRLVDDLPRSPNGKVDRRALAALPDDPPVLPRTELETQLAAAWSEILATPPRSVHDHLIEVGGNSLVAARLAALVSDRLGVRLSVADVLEYGSIAAIAGELTERRQA